MDILSIALQRTLKEERTVLLHSALTEQRMKFFIEILGKRISPLTKQSELIFSSFFSFKAPFSNAI